MNLIFYRYNSIIEPDCIEAFREMGVRCIEYTYEMTVKDALPSEFTSRFSRFLEDHPADCVFSVDFFPYISEVCEIVHLRYISWTVDAPVFELYSDSIRNSWNRTFLFDKVQYQEIAPLNPGHVFYMPLAGNPDRAKALLRERGQFGGRPGPAADSDITFIGSLYSEKNPFRKIRKLPERTAGFLDGILRAQELVYGYFFLEELLDEETVGQCKSHCEDFFTQPSSPALSDRRILAELYLGSEVTARERTHLLAALAGKHTVALYTGSDVSGLPVRSEDSSVGKQSEGKQNTAAGISPRAGIRVLGHADSLREMPLIFHDARINLNPTMRSIQSGVPLRVFDVLSAGGFLLTNYQPEIPELFTPGEELAVYGSPEELLQETDYYLQHEKERKEIAHAGQERIRSGATYVIRLSKLLLQAFEV